MALFHEMERLGHATLEDVLLRLYPAPFLKWLYGLSLERLADAYPEQLPPPDRSGRRGADKVPNKSYLVALLLAVLRNPELLNRLFLALPEPTRAVVSAATWARRLNLASLETMLGLEVARENPDKRRRYYEPLLLPVEHGFLGISHIGDSYWGYSSYAYSGRSEAKKTDFAVYLPDAVRKAFKSVVPAPAGHELEPLDEPPTGAGTRYTCADSALADLRLVAEYIAQGLLKYTKSERVAMPSLKAVGQMTHGSEFFEGSENPDLRWLRTRLLVGAIAFAGEKEREALLSVVDGVGPVRDVAQKLLNNGPFLHEELMGHLANRQNRWIPYRAASIRQLSGFFAKLPAGKWVSWENLASYHELREQVPTLFDAESGGLHANATMVGREDWLRYVTVTGDTADVLVGEPLLKGFAFLLAALGFAEITYDIPTHSRYRLSKREYLTPCDGFRCVRLTPLGEFVFHQRNTYELAGEPLNRATIVLDEARLLATCRNSDPLTELALGQFMEKLAPGRYHMTPKSLVGGCRSRKELEERIKLFRRVVSATPPAIWEAFFERTLARTSPLKFEQDYILLKVGSDEEIRHLLTSDPVLREVVLKAEGMRIAVRRQDLKKLARRLEQFGYLSPLPSLAASE